jgi:hypothetical protein
MAEGRLWGDWYINRDSLRQSCNESAEILFARLSLCTGWQNSCPASGIGVSFSQPPSCGISELDAAQLDHTVLADMTKFRWCSITGRRLRYSKCNLQPRTLSILKQDLVNDSFSGTTEQKSTRAIRATSGAESSWNRIRYGERAFVQGRWRSGHPVPGYQAGSLYHGTHMGCGGGMRARWWEL